MTYEYLALDFCTTEGEPLPLLGLWGLVFCPLNDGGWVWIH